MWEFIALAASSFGLGALHALEPGHGKAVVGAYLIGSKGRVSDAVLLGIVVTLTHSGSVILLGVLSTVAAAIFVPDTVQKVLEVASGLLVIGVGGWMLAVRIRQARGTAPGHSHPRDHEHEATHFHAHLHPHAADATNGGRHHAEHAHSHEYTAVAAHGHEHGEHHAHGPEEAGAHGHPHPRDHGHEHSHDGRGHSYRLDLAPGERPTLWQLITLGVSGGIVPCPAALAVLLAAVSYGQFAKGLSLVIVFSIGMAAVLVAIGIMMVKAASFAGRYVSESKWTKIVPAFSAGLITLLGVALTVKALVDVASG